MNYMPMGRCWEKRKELEESIYEMAGEVFNINSPKQLGVILFEKMELPNKRKPKPDIPRQQEFWRNWLRIIQSCQRFWNIGR